MPRRPRDSRSAADKEALATVRQLARQFTKDAILALHEIATDRNAEKRARVAAASALLDRGYGKPGHQAVEGEGILGGRVILDFVGRQREGGSRPKRVRTPKVSAPAPATEGSPES